MTRDKVKLSLRNRFCNWLERNFVLFLFVFVAGCFEFLAILRKYYQIIEGKKEQKIKKVQQDSRICLFGENLNRKINLPGAPSLPTHPFPKHNKSKFQKHFALSKSKQQPQQSQQEKSNSSSTLSWLPWLRSSQTQIRNLAR